MVTHAEHHRGIPLGGRNRSNKILVNLRKTAPRVSRFCPRLGLYTTTLLARIERRPRAKWNQASSTCGAIPCAEYSQGTRWPEGVECPAARMGAEQGSHHRRNGLAPLDELGATIFVQLASAGMPANVSHQAATRTTFCGKTIRSKPAIALPSLPPSRPWGSGYSPFRHQCCVPSHLTSSCRMAQP